MTNQEFSNEFDILFNNIMSNQAPGLDEYEKSVLLTSAQEELVKSSYNGRTNTQDSFEMTEEIRRYLSSLVKTFETSKQETGHIGLSPKSIFFKLPDNPNEVWFITYESAILEDESLGCMNGKEVIVVPTTQDNYSRIANNPFKGANKRQVLRLDNSKNTVEIISNYNIKSYKVRYISKPEPIVLEDLDGGISIDGVSKKTECKLSPITHRDILLKAVQLASSLYK